MDTDYDHLSEQEKNSDRKEAIRIIKCIEKRRTSDD